MQLAAPFPPGVLLFAPKCAGTWEGFLFLLSERNLRCNSVAASISAEPALEPVAFLSSCEAPSSS